MTNEVTVVSINSRKGGVGKTSIGLSAAAQLATFGRKVAFIDLDALGSQLSQCLPFDGVAVRDGNHLTFQFDGSDRSEAFRDRPYLFWWLTGRPQARRRSVEESGERLLSSDACVKWAKEHGVDDGLKAMTSNLRLFPASCYVSDLDEVNQMLMGKDTQRSYESFLTSLIQTLSKGGYEFVFIDNSPGLSLNGAMSLNWAIQLARGLGTQRGLRVNVWTWLATLSNWWEQGLLAYEINVYAEDLIRVNPVLVVNRVMEDLWLGCFEQGLCVSARELIDDSGHDKESAQRRLAELKSLFFHLPLWLGAEREPHDLLLHYVIPQALHVAILGDSTHVAHAASGVSPGSDAVTVVDPSEVSPDETGKRWGRRAEEFFARFFLPSLLSRPSVEHGDFHSQVWSASVQPLLDSVKVG